MTKGTSEVTRLVYVNERNEQRKQAESKTESKIKTRKLPRGKNFIKIHY